MRKRARQSGKQHNGTLSTLEHSAALANLVSLAALITFPPDGDISLLTRAEQIRESYGCSRSADSLCIALAEHLSAGSPSELLTYDAGQQRQATALAQNVVAALLTQ